MYKLIIFDFDGPILDSFEGARISILETRKRLIKKKLVAKKKLSPITKEGFILNWGYPGLISIKKLFPLISNKESEIFVKFWAKNDKQKKLPLVEGAKNALQKIRKAGFLTALLTTRSHNLKFYFECFDLEKYFDFLQSFDDPALPKEKAHPNHIFHPSLKDDLSFFDKVLEWSKGNNISLDEILFIDDTLAGLRITRRAKIKLLGVCTGPITSKKDWKKYGNLDKKYVINSIAELPGWLEKHRGT